MRAAFISDVHIGPSGYFNGIRRKLTEYSEEYINSFVDRVSASSDYTFAIHLGDLIQDDNRQADILNYKKGVELFSNCAVPFHHLVGNHDSVYLSLSEVASFLGYESLFYSFDADLVHCVIMYSHVPVPKIPGIVVPDDQLTWLEEDLKSTNLPTIIFIHHSLADQDLTGNPWFEGRPDDCLISNRKEVRKIITDSAKVIAVVNGHLHWNKVNMHDGIPYITVQSAIENFTDNGMPANSWGQIQVSDDKFQLEVFGNDPFRFECKFS
jgi:Icc protein